MKLILYYSEQVSWRLVLWDKVTKLLDCAYLCDNSFYNLIPQNEGLVKLEMQKRPGKAAPKKGKERRALTY
ncbi:hypothetical protein MKX03_027445 [Papaver bracteatum]|nr:hypothetical protein MKX03_034855 [Papaver bracteatum]KAI3875351.1 hypothetical protein MKX03_027445 [Papaver bracteatum]